MGTREFTFMVDEWDDEGSKIVEVIGGANNGLVARAAYEAAVKLRPNANITLRQGALVMEKTKPDS
jgi:hypothetical protein